MEFPKINKFLLLQFINVNIKFLIIINIQVKENTKN